MSQLFFSEAGEPHRLCRLCHVSYPVSEYWRRSDRKNSIDPRCRRCGTKRAGEWNAKHREHRASYMREWNKKNPDKLRAQSKRNWAKIARNKSRKLMVYQKMAVYRAGARADVLRAYGGRCVCCGEDRDHFLSIDHVMRDGHLHRASIGNNNIYLWLRRNGFPKDRFRLLCHNCNFAKGRYGVCPHEEENQQTFSVAC